MPPTKCISLLHYATTITNQNTDIKYRRNWTTNLDGFRIYGSRDAQKLCDLCQICKNRESPFAIVTKVKYTQVVRDKRLKECKIRKHVIKIWPSSRHLERKLSKECSINTNVIGSCSSNNIILRSISSSSFLCPNSLEP